MTEKESTGESTKVDRRKEGEEPKKRRIWPWVVAALLVVFVALPAGLFAYAYSQYTVPEPKELANNQVSTIYASDNDTQLARLVPPEGNRTHVTLDEVPVFVQDSVLAAEDRDFWENSGFSFTGLGRAVLGKVTGNDTAGGGSTITQQYVKNTLVGNEYSYVRKARELIYSIKMTNEWEKEDILNAYLNTVYFGRNAYGIQAASNAYFDKDAKDLTPEEGAMLAGLIQSPSGLDPRVNQEGSENRWNYVLDGLVDMGDLSKEERDGMVFPETRDPAEYSAYTEAPGANGHIKDQVIRELEDVGITENQVSTGGLRITTTIDMNVQNNTIQAVDDQLAPLQEDARAASVTIDPKTGAVRGYFGGHDSNGWDYANSPLQTGSTFKILALAAALQQGISLDTNYSSAPYQLPGSDLVTNVGGGCGVCDLREATKQSLNTSYLRLQSDLKNGTQDTADMAHALGVARSLPGIEETLTENGKQPFEGVVLGQYQSRPLDMATAMSTLANQGVWHNPHFVQRVENAAGEVLYEHPDDEGERRVSANVANNVLEAMGPVAAWSNGSLAGGRASASKTGTTQLGDSGTNKDAWMVGATPQLASAVWVGTADNTSAIFDQYGGIMYGAGAPTKIWKSVLDNSLADQEFQQFPSAYPVRFGTVSAGGGAPAYNSGGSAGGQSTQNYTGPAQNGAPEEETSPAPAESPEAGRDAPSQQPETQGGNNGNGGNRGNGGGNNEPAPPEAPSLDDILDREGGLADLLG